MNEDNDPTSYKEVMKVKRLYITFNISYSGIVEEYSGVVHIIFFLFLFYSYIFAAPVLGGSDPQHFPLMFQI